MHVSHPNGQEIIARVYHPVYAGELSRVKETVCGLEETGLD